MSTLVLDTQRRETLLEQTERIEELAAAARVAADEVGSAEQRIAWYRELQTTILELSDTLPAGTEDYEARRLLQFLTELARAIEDDPEARDETGRVELARMQIIDVLRRLDRRLQHAALDDPEEAARFIFSTLGDVSVTELAELLGVSTKTIGAWRQGKPIKANTERVTTVARLLSYLRASMTQRGVMLWFAARHDQLGRRTPLKILSEGKPDRLLALTAFARGGRAQLAD